MKQDQFKWQYLEVFMKNLCFKAVLRLLYSISLDSWCHENKEFQGYSDKT